MTRPVDPHMARALELARSAIGSASPNPPVGAVVVRDGEVVGEGSTMPAGQAHAEVVALRQAGELARGSTLYVTLEPCSHHGRTPPCAEAVIGAGISEVHVSLIDPNPLVMGEDSNSSGRPASTWRSERAGSRPSISSRRIRSSSRRELLW